MEFPVTGLDITRFIEGSKEAAIYDLCGVVNHYGALMGGHYTAFARHAASGKWHLYDDNRVSEVRSMVTSSSFVCLVESPEFNGLLTHNNSCLWGPPDLPFSLSLNYNFCWCRSLLVK